ncbi:hypothetical protein BBJ29_003981 [Phytophthora kernoviae]|uniref:PDZ domain-containing protein n=1 Tax=Phytophthora kernoviae TaxID=325452 RepID=A0A3F2RND1_9STRA|nr:hypothetical protein BBJ29_003981 [Phytophthora kernoviae]RLN60977.1 hypothetical protein BBP00_00005685 [Phytophthora kernoviae]
MNDLHTDKSKHFVRIECNTRPFLVQLAMERGHVVVHGFERSNDGKRGHLGAIERSGLVQIGDVLVAVGEEMQKFRSLEKAQQALTTAELPAVLTFRRVVTVKETLGEYTEQEIARYLVLQDNLLASGRGVEEAALLVQACIEVFRESQSTMLLQDYIMHLEQVMLPSLGILRDDTQIDKKQQFEQIKQVMEKLHQRVAARKKEEVKVWNAAKSSNYRRIEILARQRASIKERLEKMRENHKELRPENHQLWTEYIELRHLFTQLSENVEKSKQEHYLPAFEGYSLRFGSDGIYVGVGDIWIPSFHAKFTVETRSTAPHLSFHISTPSTHGLKLRAINFTLATEGRLPSFHCDELNVEAQLIADIPLVFDSIAGWTVPQEELDVKLMSFVYYERQANSTKRGKDHDTIMKMFINRMLPSVVRHATQQLFYVELGPLIQRRDAQVVLSGEMKITGRKLSVYDAALNNSKLYAKRGDDNTKEEELSEAAREIMAISDDEADVLYAIYKTFMDTHNNNNKTLFSKVETPRMCIRNLIGYFEQFNETPHLKTLACELWGQSLLLLSPTPSVSPSRRGPASSPFAPIISTIEQIKEYPVDVSISLVDVNFRLNLCEGAATYYMALQRIIRRTMDTSSVGLANLAELRDGTYLENKLTRLDARPTEPPKLKVETGDFGKCQYTAERVTLSGTVWQYVTRTQESTDRMAHSQDAAAPEEMKTAASSSFDAPNDSIWDEYLESPFFSLRFHFFMSCQVTRDHIFLSIGSASLTEPKVAQLKHRVCLGQLLQDLDMINVVDSKVSRRKAGAS